MEITIIQSLDCKNLDNNDWSQWLIVVKINIIIIL